MGHKHIHVFTDHSNLLFVFAPLTMEPSLGEHIMSKVQRWVRYLNRFEYAIKHISGVGNIYADILIGWVRGYRNEKSMCAVF